MGNKFGRGYYENSAEIDISPREIHSILEGLRKDAAQTADRALAVTKRYAGEVFQDPEFRSQLEFSCLKVSYPRIEDPAELKNLLHNSLIFVKALGYVAKSKMQAISRETKSEIKYLILCIKFMCESLVQLQKRLGLKISCEEVRLDKGRMQRTAKDFVEQAGLSCPAGIDCVASYRNLAILTQCYKVFDMQLEFIKTLEGSLR